MKKIAKSKIVSTIFSLLTLGAIAKILSTIAKIITVRLVSIETMGIYSLVTSSIVLIITIVQAGLPPTIAKMIGGKEANNARIFATATIVVTVTCSLVIFVIAIGASYFANDILKNPDTLLAIYALIPLIPLIGFGSLLKAYYIGINKIQYTAFSQISEEILRIIFLLAFVGYLSRQSPSIGAAGIMLGMAAGEIASIGHLLLYSRKKIKLQVNAFKKATNEHLLYKQMLPTAFSLTTGRLVAAFTFFVEPIILTNIMLRYNYSSDYISIEYGLLSTLAMPLLLLPGFFTNAIANAMLPVIANDIKSNNKKHAKKVIISLTGASALVGTIFSLFCFFFPNFLMKLLYGSALGSNYVSFIAIPFILYYIQTPLSSALLALGKEKSALRDTIIGSIVRLLLLIILIPSMQLYGLAVATISNVLIVTLLHLLVLIRALWE